MLPERRKTAEEIAKLREAMGIPGAAPDEPETPPVPEPAQGGGSPRAPAPSPAPPTSPPAVLFPDQSDRNPGDPAPPAALDEAAPSRHAIRKTVRSLRKSEQGPVTVADRPDRDSEVVLPAQRHSDRELMELRRTQAAPPDQSIAYIRSLAVPWPLVALGYFLPLTGALLGWLSVWTPTVVEPDFPAMWMADLSRKPWLGTAGLIALVVACVLGLLLAGWFAWKKPRSRHHAGFITIISVFIIVFAILSKFSPTHGP